MGLDPFTSAVIWDKAGDEAGVDESVTDVGSGQAMVKPAANAVVPGSGDAASNAMNKTEEKVDPEASNSGDAWSSLVSGGAALGGAYLSRPKDPKTTPTVANPYYEPMMARLLAIVDKTLTERGISAMIPEDRLPYELRTPEQRAQVRQTLSKEENDVNSKPLYQPQAPQEAPAAPTPPPVAAAPAVDPTQAIPYADTAPATSLTKEADYTDAAMAATLAARRQGIVRDTPMFTTPREVFEREQMERQKPVEDVYNYIYGQRTTGV